MSHYDTVGVNADASDEEIKKAYKSRAGKVHPDKPNGDTEKFKDLNHAYSVISDPERKALYDLTGSDEKPKDYMAEAGANLAQIFLRIINEERKGDIVGIVTDTINTSISQAKQNREKVKEHIVKFELLIDRVVSKSDTNVCNNILEEQIKGLNLQLKQFNDFIKVGDLMLVLLEDYTDSKPDVEVEHHNPWGNGSHFRGGIGGVRETFI